MNVKTFTAVAALIGLSIPSISLAEPLTDSERAQKQAACEADAAKDPKLNCAKLLDCEQSKQDCEDKLAHKNDVKPVPQPKFDFLCGPGTVEEKENGGRAHPGQHCTCQPDPVDLVLVTGKFDGSVKVEVCLPSLEAYHQLAKPKEDNSKLLRDIQARLVVVEGEDKEILTNLIPGLDGRIKALEERANENDLTNQRQDDELNAQKKRLEHLADIQLYGGVAFLLGGRNGVDVGGGVTGGLLGWFSRYVGLNVDVTLGANYEPTDSKDLGTVFSVEGGIGPAFRPLDGLTISPLLYGRQNNRVDSRGAGLIGNEIGYGFGGALMALIKPWSAPVAIKLGGDVVYGSVAGTVNHKTFEGPMVQGGGQFGLVFTGDIFLPSSKK